MTAKRNGMDQISVDPDVCGGEPRIRGTRIPVSVIPDNLAAGVGTVRLPKNYPSLTRRHVRAAIAYAAELARARAPEANIPEHGERGGPVLSHGRAGGRRPGPPSHHLHRAR